jgi:hypothetical protein
MAQSPLHKISDTLFGSADRKGLVDWNNLAGDEPIEEHPNRCEVLLYRRLVARTLLDVGGDYDWIDLFDGSDAALIKPVKESLHHVAIGPACIFVSNARGKKLDEGVPGEMLILLLYDESPLLTLVCTRLIRAFVRR